MWVWPQVPLGGDSPSTPPAPKDPSPTPVWAAPSRSIAQRVRGVGGRGRETVGREGLWLEGKGPPIVMGGWGGTFQRAVAGRPTSGGSLIRRLGNLGRFHPQSGRLSTTDASLAVFLFKVGHFRNQKSGQVGPRQGTEICNFGAPSPLEALHWIFCYFSSIYVQFSKTSPTKSGESSEKSRGENRVKSCHVCGCHGLSGPEKRLGMAKFKRTFGRTIRNNLRAPHMKMWGFEAKGPDNSPNLRHGHCHGVSLPCFLSPRSL